MGMHDGEQKNTTSRALRCAGLSLIVMLCALPAGAQEIIVYGGSGAGRGANVFLERASSIDVISPQVYAVDSLGNVYITKWKYSER